MFQLTRLDATPCRTFVDEARALAGEPEENLGLPNAHFQQLYQMGTGDMEHGMVDLTDEFHQLVKNKANNVVRGTQACWAA